MITNQDFHRDTKCLAIDDNKIPKKIVKKEQLKQVLFGPKPNTLIYSQEESSFTTPAP